MRISQNLSENQWDRCNQTILLRVRQQSILTNCMNNGKRILKAFIRHIKHISMALRVVPKHLISLLQISVLTTATSKSIENLFLEVRESNHAAQSLYAKWGFTQIAIRENYYRPSTPDGPRENALVYMRAMY